LRLNKFYKVTPTKICKSKKKEEYEDILSFQRVMLAAGKRKKLMFYPHDLTPIRLIINGLEREDE